MVGKYVKRIIMKGIKIFFNCSIEEKYKPKNLNTMKNISDKIFESFSAKDMSKLEELAYDMFKEYSSTWPVEELKDYANGKYEPDEYYWEMIDDILEYCEDKNIKISASLKKELSKFDKDNREVDSEDIKLAILRSMNKIVNEK